MKAIIEGCPWCQSQNWIEVPSRFAMVNGVEQIAPAYNYCPDCDSRFNNPEVYYCTEEEADKQS